MEIIRKFGLIDFFLLILFLRIIYSAVSRGILSEILKIAGVFIGGVLSFHYYNFFTKGPGAVSVFLGASFVKVSLFLVILSSVTLVFSLLQRIITTLFKKETLSSVEKWAACLVGACRFSFTSSVLFFLLYLVSFKLGYVERNISYRLFKNIAPVMYFASVKLGSISGHNINRNEEIQKYYEAKSLISACN